MTWRVEVQAKAGGLALHVEVEGSDRPLLLVGPNGSGKTTLLRVIAGLQPAQSGRIAIGERTVFERDAGVDLPPEARRIGYVPQGYALFPHLSVLENVAFGLSVGSGRSSAEQRRAAARMLEDLECGALADRTPVSLSGGEKQRVALARALVIRPAMLLLDEPLAALDVVARGAVRRFLAARLRDLGRPSIVVSHDARDADALGAEVCVLENGRVSQRGTVSQLRAAPASDFVAEFVRSSASDG